MEHVLPEKLMFEIRQTKKIYMMALQGIRIFQRLRPIALTKPLKLYFIILSEKTMHCPKQNSNAVLVGYSKLFSRRYIGGFSSPL